MSEHMRVFKPSTLPVTSLQESQVEVSIICVEEQSERRSREQQQTQLVTRTKRML